MVELIDIYEARGAQERKDIMSEKQTNLSGKEILALDAARFPNGHMSTVQRLFRKVQTSRGIIKFYYRLRYRFHCQKRSVELPPSVKAGPGLYIGHPYNFTVNPKVVIGSNCNIHKGVMLGQENRGPRKGAPVIGDNVWIGIGAAVVGHVTIGDDVLIAANSYVNCDIPPHSIVFGNPRIIKHKEGATEGYINNKI